MHLNFNIANGRNVGPCTAFSSCSRVVSCTGTAKSRVLTVTMDGLRGSKLG